MHLSPLSISVVTVISGQARSEILHTELEILQMGLEIILRRGELELLQ